ncbi:peptidase M3A and M3B thimet/oligopeptidase F [Rhizoclosmatium globosum]|uniref:oligopeptidase A n=1 Tax=Rhizoclosmatium globosum TaxID=329046 RepID=A0A1Y2CHC3_9FUNG|nr:peptidase M3A and M3B thimet/oligopeptidase F [Rhizoclosmatium globosum]|eukprot:ORY46451.1 peptidase M3A and M3B thimet/oligopeptidase F [Rhizoclosmatium globosum]
MLTDNSNPLLADCIKTEHFQPAMEVTMKDHLAEVKAIAENPEPATFDNTFKLYDRAGAQFYAIIRVFYNLTGSANVPELQKVQRAMAGPLSDHYAAVRTTPGLFDRIRTVYESRESLELDAQQLRLVERVYQDFVHQGALFDKAKQDQNNAIVKELSLLSTQFSQNLLADEGEVVPVTLEELDGCPEYLIAKGYVVSVSRSMVEPFLSSCKNPEARERVFQAFISRGEFTAEKDNKAIATPEAVLELLNRVWAPAKDAANREREMLAEYAKSVGESEVIRPSDWRFYAERVRETKYDLDELFDVAYKLYGLTFVLRPDIKAYHEDVLVYEVHEQIDGQDTIRAIFFHDNFARQYKRGGAWMSEFRSQNRNIDDLGTNQIPIVINNNNFTKGADGQPTLLSFNDCVTLFHEFGHGCHGMLSDSKYQRLASTRVLKDFVELPSQLMEHWFRHPEVLAKYAIHYETNEPIPAELLTKLMASRKFQQGFATVEYAACALVDQALHALPAKELATLDLSEFEKSKLAELDMPAGIVMRHRIPQFSHLFSGPGYAAGYYVYLWAEVLDADAFDAFLETGDIFDKATAARARKYIYSSGSTIDHMEGYRAFRGKDASIEPMLKKKGLLVEA